MVALIGSVHAELEEDVGGRIGEVSTPCMFGALTLPTIPRLEIYCGWAQKS